MWEGQTTLVASYCRLYNLNMTKFTTSSCLLFVGSQFLFAASFLFTVPAWAGTAASAKRSSIGLTVQNAIAGIYSSLSPAQATLISTFLNSPVQPDVLIFRQNLQRTANLPRTLAARDPMESATSERIVQLAQSDKSVQTDLAIVVTRHVG